MANFERFNYKNLDELKADIERMGLDIPVAGDTGALGAPLEVYGKRIPNRLVVNPMEGCDSEQDGSPSELVFRRYSRFARGGCGLIWVEACAVVHEGRANPRQLYIHKENAESFKRLAEYIREQAREALGEGFEPFLVLQLTHSGRYAKPGDGLPAVIAAQNPWLDRFLPASSRVITDDELAALEDRFAEAAVLAKNAGFDAVDIKACHRYLNSELLSAHTREGLYGGSFENRTRFILNVADKIARCTDIGITTRMNAFDQIPYPYGWGVSREDMHIPDLSEPIKLAGLLYEKGVEMVNITIGNPYYNPHVNRPFDNGFYRPPTHPLEGVRTILSIARDIQRALPDMRVISSGLSWLRELGAEVAAGCVEQGWCAMAGFGRQSFAYPDFAKDISRGAMERGKCCIACGKCTEIMRDGGRTGCVIRDNVYMPIYKAGREGKPALTSNEIKEHI